MSTENLGFEEIDLNVSPEEELERISALDDNVDGTTETETETDGAGDESSAGEDGGDDAQSADSSEDSSAGDGSSGDAAIDQMAETLRVLENLRAERARLQEQLSEVAVGSLADRRRLDELERSLQAAKEASKTPAEPEGPTPEQIISHLDARIAAVDKALTQAENENPSEAPALRQTLRKLERYYNNFVSQQTLAAARGPDPEVVVQKAVEETNQQNRFASIKANIINEFPVLDVKSPYFDEGLRDQVHRIYNPMIAAGADPTQALIEATMLVTRANGVASMTELYQQQRLAAEQAAQQAAKQPAAKEKAAARKADAVKKNLAAAEATPPVIASAGASGATQGVLDKYDFGKMSINEMLRMTPEQEEQVEMALAMYND